MGRKQRGNVVYEMRREGWKAYFELHVSTTPTAMKEHAAETYRNYGLELPSEWEGTVGLVCPLMRLGCRFGEIGGAFRADVRERGALRNRGFMP